MTRSKSITAKQIDLTVTCPACGFTSDDTDDFDVMFACWNNLFCNQCNCEFDPDTGKRHDAETCKQCGTAKTQRTLF